MNSIEEILNLKNYNMKYLKDLVQSRNGYYDQQTLSNIKRARELHDSLNEKLTFLGYRGDIEKKEFFTNTKVPYSVAEEPIETFEFLTNVSEDCLLNEDVPMPALRNNIEIKLTPVDLTENFDDSLIVEPSFEVTEKESENLLFFKRLELSRENKKVQEDVYNIDYVN